MERCSVKPYKGMENYIFISFSQLDKEYAFPIIERLSEDGYRVWYHENTENGLEWMETIAKHIKECSVCIALVSEHFVDSHACRREINFAMKKRKKILPVMLETVENMSLGMEMQLSALPTIYKYSLDEDNELFVKFYETDLFENCLNEETSEAVSDEKETGFYLLRQKSNEKIRIASGGLMLGRSAAMCGYIIRDNSMVGRCHANIAVADGFCRLMDYNSLNGTFLNGNRIVAGKEYILQEGDCVLIANEAFSFHRG